MAFSENQSADERTLIHVERPPGVETVLRQLLETNAAYAQTFGDKAKLVGAPRHKLAVLTCMDARLDPARFIGLNEGDAHVIRNAGGRASDDAIRSLVVSCKLMGTTDWLVIHHSGCGMQSYSDDDIRHLLGLEDEAHHAEESKWHHVKKSAQTPADIHWLTFSDLSQSIVEDVEIIRRHPLVPPSIAIYGYIYHIHHGTLEPVPAANRIGAPGG